MSTTKTRRRLKPGLLHSSRAVEVQYVNARMKVFCLICGQPPQRRRLLVRIGSGRHAKSQVMCNHCGRDWLADREQEYKRAAQYLGGLLAEDESIRL